MTRGRARRRRARDSRRGRHRSGRSTRSRWRTRRERQGAELCTRCRVESIERASDAGLTAHARRRARPCDAASAVNCAGPRRRRGRPAGRRRVVLDLPAQGRVPRVRSAARASRSTGSCCRSRPSARRACSCSRRSTARSSRDRPRSTWRTRTTGRCGPRRASEIVAKAAALYPPLADAEPVSPTPGCARPGAGQLRDRPRPATCPRLIHVAAIRSTGLTASLGIARARHRDRRARWASSSEPRRPLRGGRATHRRRALVAADRRVPRSACRHDAAARDRRGHVGGQGRPVRRATCARSPRRAARSGSPIRRPGWVEQDPTRCSTPWSTPSPSCSPTPPSRGDRVRARPPGRVGARLGRGDGRAADADRRLAGQALAGGARPARGDGRGEEIDARSGPAARPVLLGGQARLAARARRRACSSARAPGTLRMGTVDAFLCDRLGAGFATDPSTASRTQLGAGAPTGIRLLLERSACPPACCPRSRDTAGELGVLRHGRWPQRAAAARAVRRPAGGARGRGLRRARAASRRPTGPACSCSPTPASERPRRGGGLLPTVAWRVGGRVEWAIDGGVFTAGALLDWLSRDLGLAADPAALAARRGDRRGRRRRQGAARAGRASARRGGSPTRAAVIAGLTRGVAPGHIARAALEGDRLARRRHRRRDPGDRRGRRCCASTAA